MEHSSSWEANSFSASQEIPLILWNPNVHYRIHEPNTCPYPEPDQSIPSLSKFSKGHYSLFNVSRNLQLMTLSTLLAQWQFYLLGIRGFIFRFQARQIYFSVFPKIQTSYVIHTASNSVGTGFLLRKLKRPEREVNRWLPPSAEDKKDWVIPHHYVHYGAAFNVTHFESRIQHIYCSQQ